ncbi:MAG: glucose-6-phosphate isomerase, partial [Pseudoxanthomonas sp.]
MSMKPGFETLQSHASRLQGEKASSLLNKDPARASDFALRQESLYFNFARQSYDRDALAALLALAQSRDLAGAYRRLFDGEKVNVTEDRAALHTALRGNHSGAATAREAYATASAVRQRMGALVAELEASGITDIVSVGIGGSDLGPRLVADALRAPAGGRFRVHFL